MRLAAAVALLLVLTATSVQAYPKVLSDEDLRSAIAYGVSRKGHDLVEPSHPSFFTIGTTGYAILYTPWMMVALDARKAATEYRDLGIAEARKIATDSAGTLRLFASIIDTSDRFWDNPHAVFMQGPTRVQPTAKTSSFSRVVSCYSRPCSIRADFLFAFTDNDLDGNQSAEAVIILRGGYKEHRATFNLSAVR